MNPQVCTWLVINSCCAAHPDGIIGILISNDVYCGERDMAREVDSKNPTPPYGTGILFEEPNPTGSRPRGLIGLYRKWQRAKSRDPNQLGSIGNGKQERERGANTSKVRRARRRWWHGGSKWGEVKHREEGGGDSIYSRGKPRQTLCLRGGCCK